jgi:hypothetical protein
MRRRRARRARARRAARAARERAHQRSSARAREVSLNSYE